MQFLLVIKMYKEIEDGYVVFDNGDVFDSSGQKVRSFLNGKYWCVYIGKGANRKKKYIHKLVAEAFLPRANGCSNIMHLDGNFANNNATNLMWCNKSQLMRAACVKKDYIMDITTGKTYNSYGAAAEDVCGSRHGVYFTAIGIQAHHKGHIFKIF